MTSQAIQNINFDNISQRGSVSYIPSSTDLKSQL